MGKCYGNAHRQSGQPGIESLRWAIKIMVGTSQIGRTGWAAHRNGLRPWRFIEKHHWDPEDFSIQG
jgi:hypothetical protein